MRFRLRYQHHDLELATGQFALGRSASCQLALDDPLVSRRHALLVVDDQTATVEDLASRNGVLVNGKRIEGRVQLAPGDRLTIGSQELTLLHGRPPGSSTEVQQTLNSTLARVTTPSSDVGHEDTAATSVHSPEPRSREARSMRAEPLPADLPDEEPSVVKRADAFRLLAGVADKAMAMGRAQEAERLLATPLSDAIEACRARRVLPPATLEQAAKLAAKLATTTAKGVWADYVIELYAIHQRPVPAPVIDELYTAMRKVALVDVNRLRAYVDLLRSRIATYGPAERFLIQRLEGLERLAALR